jgi:Rieske Fe-S protein
MPNEFNDESEAALRDVSRRVLLRGAAAGGVALPLLAACGSDGNEGASEATSSAPASEPSTPDPSTPAGSAKKSRPAAPAEGVVATSKVPVGGGTILADEKIVVTQPTKGDFKAFTAVCTHQGCVVASVEDEQIVCGCHGSHYSIVDGSNISGPAPEPLAEIPITVEGNQILRS